MSGTPWSGPMTDHRWWLADVLVALVLTVAGVAAVRNSPGGLVQVLLALPLLVFLPGYALVSVVFPTSTPAPSALASFDAARAASPGDRGGTVVGAGAAGRLGLSVVSSAVIVPLVALAANFSPDGLTLEPILGGVAAVTVGLLLVATGRRLRYPSDERFAMPTFVSPSGIPWSDDSHRFQSNPWNATVPNLVLAVGVFLVASSIGYAAVAAPTPDPYTEFRVGTEDMTGDTRTLYRSSFPRGRTTPLDVVVTNHEGGRTEYTVVAVLQRIEVTGGSVAVRESEVVGERDLSVDAGERRRAAVDVEPSMDGDDHRLLVLLYRDGAPADVGAGNAYRTLRLDVTVDGDDGESASLAPPARSVEGGR